METLEIRALTRFELQNRVVMTPIEFLVDPIWPGNDIDLAIWI
jgi:hypothetical protein